MYSDESQKTIDFCSCFSRMIVQIQTAFSAFDYLKCKRGETSHTSHCRKIDQNTDWKVHDLRSNNPCTLPDFVSKRAMLFQTPLGVTKESSATNPTKNWLKKHTLMMLVLDTELKFAQKD